MQPDQSPPGFPHPAQPPSGGPWSGGPQPPPARAQPVAAMIAGILALFTTCALVWFGFHDVFYANSTGDVSSMVIANVLTGTISAASLLVAAGFTFVRRVPAAWTLCGLCAFYSLAFIVGAPLVFGTPWGYHLGWVFGFDKGNGIAIGLAVVFSMLTAIVAAIAGSVKSYAPTPSDP